LPKAYAKLRAGYLQRPHGNPDDFSDLLFAFSAIYQVDDLPDVLRRKFCSSRRIGMLGWELLLDVSVVGVTAHRHLVPKDLHVESLPFRSAGRTQVCIDSASCGLEGD
jgi:hypothetical protein